ncbi:PAS domain-containing protein [Maritimibacter sp. 55A14]|uniref:PAS domain-containing protein n=1 Tax=Maritimibacter sp. 55A14 TaxID=2174844 RepID=UPI001304BC23|nr:PAS domain-containing protein [Maritimibacter sp. 55A14]
MSDRCLKQVLDYWETLRAGRAAPMRSELDPRRIEDALEYTFILERAGPGTTRIRIAGMHLCDLMGMETRGMSPASLLEPADRGRFGALLDRLFAGREIIELDLVARAQGRMSLSARMILLPMRSDLGEMTRALGCLVTDGIIGAPPRRFAIARQRITRIVSGAPAPHAAPGFAEPAPRFTPTEGKTGPHLRLVYMREED